MLQIMTPMPIPHNEAVSHPVGTASSAERTELTSDTVYESVGQTDLYQVLPETGWFRLLELYAGSDNEPLRGKLWQPLLLAGEPKYEALSYRWTDPEEHDSAHIDLEGILLSLGPNLRDGLQQLRHQSLSRWLWIDQICINQTDPDDKNMQLQIMGDIYKKSQNVLVWLGRASVKDKVAMEIFPLLVEQTQHRERASELRQAVPSSDIIPWRGMIANCLHELFSNSWFGRVWTLQEAALGPKTEVWCGQTSFAFEILDTFERGCESDHYGHWAALLKLIGSGAPFNDPQRPLPPPNAHVHIVFQLKQESRLSSARMLNTLRPLDCMQQQDRIMSILRFLDRDLQAEVLQVHHSGPAMLYKLVARHELQRGRSEHLGAAGMAQQSLTYFEGTEHNEDGLALPSWVADWSYRPRTHSLWVYSNECKQKRDHCLLAAGGSESAFACVVDDQDRLTIQGWVIGSIDQMSDALRIPTSGDNLDDQNANTATSKAAFTTLQSFVEKCTKLAALCTDMPETIAELSCKRSLVAGMAPDDPASSTKTGVFAPITTQELRMLYDDFDAQMKAFEELDSNLQRMLTDPQFAMAMLAQQAEGKMSLSPPQEVFSKKHNLIDSIAEACKGRRFFISKCRRYMGLVPDISSPGDEIAIMAGCCAPFVLRPGESDYKLVGECYVEGVMHGEMLQKGMPLRAITLL